MKTLGQMLILVLLGIVFLLIMVWNANNYDNKQNKAQNDLIGQLY